MGQKINEREIKPTFDEPKSDQAINFQDKFNKTMLKHNVQLNEVDILLTEKEQSLKKKIFDLGKAETLIHSDPKLSAIYDKMSEDGKEKYGYHYNETIVNIIFNDYVLNDARYLQKYKQAVPKKKKRRDKSGINALKKSAEELEKKRQEYQDRMSGKAKENLSENSNTSISSAGSYETPVGFKDDVKNVSKEIDTQKEEKELKKVEVAFPGQEKRAYGKHTPAGKNVSSAVANPEPNKEAKKPYYPGGKVTTKDINESTVASNSGAFSTKAGDKQNYQSNKIDTDKEWDDLNDPEVSVVSKEKKMKDMSKNKASIIDDSNLVGGSNAKPSYPGGKILKNPNNTVNENFNSEYKEDVDETTSAGAGATGSGGVADYTYVGPAVWGGGDLAKGKKTKKDKESFWKGGKVIQESEYLTNSDGFEKYIEMLNEDFNLDEDHAKTRDQKIDIILQFLNSQDDGTIVSAENLEGLSDVALDQTYADVERLMGIAEQQLNEDHLQTRDQKIKFIMNNMDDSMPFEVLQDMSDDDIDTLYQELESSMDMYEGQLNEKAKSKAQQRFMGMVHAYQKGELDGKASPAIKKAAKSMSDEDAEDFASTKHKGLPEKVDENNTEITPEEDDCFIESNGFKLSVSCGGKYLGDFIEDEKAYDAVKQWKIDNNFYPNTWYVSDHGNINLINDDGKFINENPALMTLGTAAAGGFGQAMGDRVADKVGLEENYVEYVSDRQGEEPFEMGGQKWQFVNAKYPDGNVDIGVYKFGEDLVYDYNWFRQNIVGDKSLNEDHLQKTSDQLEFILNAWELLSPKNVFNKNIQREIWSALPPNKIKMFYDTTEKMLRDKGIYPHSIGIDETMFDNQEDSMKMKPPIGNDRGMGDFPTGMQIATTGGGLNENKKNNDIMKDSEKYLNEANKELNLFEMHHNKLKEERKPSTLVMKDRLGSENEQNFKKDLKHSGTKEIIDVTKELEWKDQQTNVPKDPQKLGKDIEKEALKNTNKGTALKNVGNSTNNDGDEIPKRNLTDEEANEVDLYRKGLSDVIFDNKPDERFEERMKRDMGDKIYKERQQTMDLEAEAPMYNKDTQPYEKGIKKDQFDKEKTGWNDRLGINEAVVTGKYKDKYGKTKFHDFNMKDVKEINETKQVNLIPLNLNGMGNTYSNKVELNESVSKAINDWDFYLFEGHVVAYKSVQKLNESEQKDKNTVNEQFTKMQHLLGYKPNDFIDSKKTKL